MSDEIRAALDAVAAGDLDALPPEQVASLEEYLNSDADAAALVGAVKAAPESAWQPGVPQPSQEQWDRVWNHVDQRLAAAKRRRVAPRILRLWAPLAAAAAGLMGIAWWELRARPVASDWPVEWAHQVEIDHLEVADGSTPFVITGEGDHGISVIWVLDENS